ncbi:dihydrouridine synthase-domain-containing protein [Crepidotus variabilis]|uniref:tRNA-dihydrouridine(16/17) synthase [NAD(P)(+)] n=1 Tax=Crepidotus variabilis TaxID=179855 RepID=A0A9P6ELJ8_9AGAR|nr:dihydrouridine synthase-domain-containing protein [Crepidotus variabilis]
MSSELTEMASTSAVTLEASKPNSDTAPKHQKLGGYDFYRQTLGSPKYVVAPMVDQSELAWRRLSRRYGAQLIYTPMINAKIFVDSSNQTYRQANFDMINGEEGDPNTDRPLIVQFCANNPDQLLTSALAVEKHCDAIDLNLGCPQDIAKKGRYGSFLQDDWELIYKLVNTLHTNLSIPVTAKFRVFPTVEKTVEYAKMLERAGAQIIACHGRIREQRGQNTGLADWSKIRAVKEAISVPVFANGNILYQSDIIRCLQETGADGVMSAEGQLYNPALFNGIERPLASSFLSPAEAGSEPESAYESDEEILIRQPLHADLALEYLDIVDELKTATNPSAVKGHLFKIMRPALAKEPDLREKLGKVRISPKKRKELVKAYRDICEEMKMRMDRDAKVAEGTPLKALTAVEPMTGLQVMPHWLAQPYFRPSPEQRKTYSEKKTEDITNSCSLEQTTAPDTLEASSVPKATLVASFTALPGVLATPISKRPLEEDKLSESVPANLSQSSLPPSPKRVKIANGSSQAPSGSMSYEVVKLVEVEVQVAP